MTEAELAEIEERAAKATPGPWWVYDDEFVGWVFDEGPPSSDLGGVFERGHDDANFVAQARTDVPALCAEVRLLQAALQEFCLAADAVLRIHAGKSRAWGAAAVDESNEAYDRLRRCAVKIEGR